MAELTFKISSGLKSILGKELIDNDFVAIFELVKNSYDANAKEVKIVFQNVFNKSGRDGARILVIDNGDGMSYEDLVNKFLFVGYSEKRDREDTPAARDFRDKIQQRRAFAGTKGIGRFACDMLGSRLDIYTKKISENEIHHLSIDWEKFETDQKTEFQIIKPIYSELKHLELKNCGIKDFQKGTILEISSLIGRWDEKTLIKLKRYLQRLINPAQVGNDQEFRILIDAKEFADHDKKSSEEERPWEVINGRVDSFLFEDLGIKTTEIKSEISEDGRSIVTGIKDKGEYVFSLKEKNAFAGLKNIKVRMFYLNPEAKRVFTRRMGLEPIRYGSIFLYKNGIRIHPYGDEEDDWLGLERRKTQGTKRFLSSRELMGRIEIYGYQQGFIEVSSRSGGIIKNAQYDELQDYFRTKVLRRLERYVVEGLDWDTENTTKTREAVQEDSIKLIKQIAGQGEGVEVDINKNLLGIVRKREVEKLPEIIKNIEYISRFIKKPDVKSYAENQIKAVRSVTRLIERAKKETEEELKIKKRESLFLAKAVSSDTETLMNLNHTIENSTITIKELINEINENIREKRPLSDILPLIDSISIENEKIRVLAGFVSLANFNTKVEEINKDIVLYIEEYLGVIKSKAMSFRFHDDDIEFVTKFKPLEISIVLDNFISNSKKARATILHVKFEVDDRKLHVYFSDNGRGVDTGVIKYMFERGFTTTNGSGIGLHHIKSIIESMGGTVRFAGNNLEGLGRGACFEVVLNANK